MGQSARNLFRQYWLLLILSIGLVLAIFVLAFSGWNMRSDISNLQSRKHSNTVTDLTVMTNLLEQFRLDMGRYPTTEEGLFALRDEPVNNKNWKGPYLINHVPLDPWGNEYYYESLNIADEYILLSFGADCVEGGEGLDADIYYSDES